MGMGWLLYLGISLALELRQSLVGGVDAGES